MHQTDLSLDISSSQWQIRLTSSNTFNFVLLLFFSFKKHIKIQSFELKYLSPFVPGVRVEKVDEVLHCGLSGFCAF